MGEEALAEAGYYRPDGTTKNDWRGSWTGKNGINNLSDFLNNSDAQTQAVTAFHSVVWNQISSSGLANMVGQTFQGVPITQSGLIAGGHLIGVAGLKRCINGGKCTDANNTTAHSYMNRFGGFDVSNLTGSNPVVADSGGNPLTPAPTGQPGASNTSAPFPASAVSADSAFAAGSGFTMSAAKDLVLGILAVSSLLWAASNTRAQYVNWAKERIKFIDMQSNIISCAVLLALILFVTVS
jgi:integrating conjugative element protein (TIGR03758 family)